MSANGQRTKWCRNIAENFNRLSRAHERCRQTTDGRPMTYSERKREFTFAKNSTLRNFVGYYWLVHEDHELILKRGPKFRVACTPVLPRLFADFFVMVDWFYYLLSQCVT